MQKIDKKKIYRLIDANFNRTKEGLRVCEDICRFVLDSKTETRNFKDIRHQLTKIIEKLDLALLISSRSIETDVGVESSISEFERKECCDIFYANSQRVKESIRVLEEIFKLINKKEAQNLKNLRYKIYAIEKKIIKKL